MLSEISSVSSKASPARYIQSCIPPYTGYHADPFVMPRVARNCRDTTGSIADMDIAVHAIMELPRGHMPTRNWTQERERERCGTCSLSFAPH